MEVIRIPPASAKRLSPLDNSLFNVWRQSVLADGPLTLRNIKRRMSAAWKHHQGGHPSTVQALWTHAPSDLLRLSQSCRTSPHHLNKFMCISLFNLFFFLFLSFYVQQPALGAPDVTCSTTSQTTHLTYLFIYFLFASRQGQGQRGGAELLARVVVSCLNHMINMAAYSMYVFTTQCRCLVYASCLPSSCVYSAGRESSNFARNFGCT